MKNIKALADAEEQRTLDPAGLPGTVDCSEFSEAVSGLPKSEKEKQDEHYTGIVEAFKTNYINKRDDNRDYKYIFFWVTIGTLVVIVASFVALCIGLLLHAERWTIVLPVMGGGAATVIVALLKLPQIIAKHLFPLNEDAAMVKLIKALKDKH